MEQTVNQELAALHRGLGRLEGKMDILLTQINQHLLEDTARFDKVNNRVDANTKKIWTLSGGIAALVLVADKAIAYFLK